MTEKYIYKITNLINNKCYIGQTKDYERRFREHKSRCDNNAAKILYKAFEKYGIENFSFEIIEDKTPFYNEREKYWIAFYDSYNNGYNMTPGGEEPPVKYGEDHQLATHSKKDVEKVIDLLKTTSKSFKEIGQITNYDDTTVARINKGLLWFNNTLEYPIRKEDTYSFKKERALLIINDLLNSDLTQKQIAEKYQVGRSTVTAINNGQNHRQNNLTYPIRSHQNNKNYKPVLMCDPSTKEIIKVFPTLQQTYNYLGISRDEGFRKKLNEEGCILNNFFWIYKK